MKSLLTLSSFTKRVRAASAPLLVIFLTLPSLHADVIPHLISHQGRVVVNGTNFTGTGLFTFSLLNTGGTHWTSGQRSIPVTNGLYSVNLGESPMPAIPTSVFANQDLKLRIEFNDQVNGSQTLSPDQAVTTAGYAFIAEQLCLPFEGAITDPDVLMDLINEGAGGVVFLEIDNAANSENALTVLTNGTGRALDAENSGLSGAVGVFRSTNASNADAALEVQHSGSGSAFRAFNEGSGMGGEISVSSATNTQSALVVSTLGSGVALNVIAADKPVGGAPGNAANFIGIVDVYTDAHDAVSGDPTLASFVIDNVDNDAPCVNIQTSGGGTALIVNAGTGAAANLDGNVQVTGTLQVNQLLSANGGALVNGNLNVTGTLTKNSGSFRIDHPLDPGNKYLYHSFVESPDMMNVYNGNVTTDGNGDATIELPTYFEALNKDFRYQLTVLGDRFAMARVSSKIRDLQFSIKTNEPGVEVSWQVTGIRKDRWANDNRIQVEPDKPENEKGQWYGMKETGS